MEWKGKTALNTIALVGNPNSGKTTVFNALTGANQHVGNWPGVTVEKKTGKFRFDGELYNVVDLPGTYSLGAISEDEIIARDFILNDRPGVVINIVDATNIERNLYLTTQLLEMGVKVVIALNMMDEAKDRKISFDLKALSKKLGVPVVPMVASKRVGLTELMETAVVRLQENGAAPVSVSYGLELDGKIAKIQSLLTYKGLGYPSRWLAVKLVEGDEYVLDLLQANGGPSPELAGLLAEFKEAAPCDLEMVDKRFEFVNNIARTAVFRPKELIRTKTDQIDKILTHRYLGLPIFALIMLGLFQITFVLGEDLLGELAAEGISVLGQYLEAFLVSLNAPAWLLSFAANGFIGGVGAVVEFIPLILVLYMLLGILEDSGYMARAAYVMDNTMRAVGLQGKTFISMIVGFGCNVPGVLATRTLDNKKDRMIAILINPFMSCGAKIPIYLVFIAAFFPRHGGLVLFAIYSVGILIALLMGRIFGKTLFRGESSHFILELPPYRRPTARNVLRNMWDNVSEFLLRAGTTIFAVVSVLWILAVLPSGVTPYGQESILGQIGLAIAPLFRPAGFGSWQSAVGLFSGIAAKEVVIATLGMVYAGVEAGSELVTAIQSHFTPLTGISFMVMTLLYTPCAATLATIKKETGSWGWMLFTALYTFFVGWVMAVLVFQIGSLFGLA